MSGSGFRMKGHAHIENHLGVVMTVFAALLTFHLALKAGFAGWCVLVVAVVPIFVLALFYIIARDGVIGAGCGLLGIVGVGWVGYWLGLKGWTVFIPPGALLGVIAAIALVMLIGTAMSGSVEDANGGVDISKDSPDATLSDNGPEIQDESVREAASEDIKTPREPSRDSEASDGDQ